MIRTNRLNLVDRQTLAVYTEIRRHPPNRYILQNTGSLSVNVDNQLVQISGRDTVDLTLISDEEVAGTGTATAEVVGFESLNCSVTYTIEAKKISFSRLSSLSLSTGTLHPSFNPSISRYFAAVPNNTRQITLRFNTEDSRANITVNNDPATTNATILLGQGNNTITINVQTKAGTRSVYIIDIIRLAQRNFNPLGTWETTARENINSQCLFSLLI